MLETQNLTQGSGNGSPIVTQEAPPAEPADHAIATKLRVRKFTSWEDLDKAYSGWNDFLADSASRTIFLTWEWLRSWWQVYGSSSELLLLVCTETDGALAGIATLCVVREHVGLGRSMRVLQLIGDASGDSDNLDFICRDGYESRVTQSVLDWLHQHSAEWDILDFNRIPAESAVAMALHREVVERRWPRIERRSVHLVTPLPGTWEQYLGSLSKKMRKNLRAYMVRAEKRYKVRLRKCQVEEEVPHCLEQLFRMHSQRWQLRGETGSFLISARCNFYDQVARQFLSRGCLEFWFLDLDGVTVAAEFGFRDSDTYFILQCGFDPAYASDSVASVLKSLVIQQLIAEGFRWYDFLGGEDPYKLRWGAERRFYYHLRSAQPASWGALSVKLVKFALASKGWLKSCLPQPILDALRRFRQNSVPGTETEPEAEK